MKVIKNMEKRGWVILAFLVLGSLLWKDWKLTLGVALGGGVALGDVVLMRTLFSRMVLHGRGKVLFVFQVFKYLALAVLFGTLFLLKLVNPLGVLVGLSLLVLMPVTGLPGIKRELEEVA